MVITFNVKNTKKKFDLATLSIDNHIQNKIWFGKDFKKTLKLSSSKELFKDCANHAELIRNQTNKCQRNFIKHTCIIFVENSENSCVWFRFFSTLRNIPIIMGKSSTGAT